MTMATIKLAMAGMALVAGAPMAMAKEGVASVGAMDTGKDWRTNRNLKQRYCIIDSSLQWQKAGGDCRSLAEWQVNRIDPRTMQRL